MPTHPPAVSIVIHADGPWDETCRCLMALHEATAGVPHERIVMDDATTDETRLALPHLDGVVAARTETRGGFARSANAALELVRAPLVVFLHADAEPRPGWLAPLVRMAEADPGVSAVASRLVDPAGLVESDGILLAYAAPYPMTPVPHGAGAPALPASDAISVPAASAAALLVRSAALQTVGGFDEELGPAAAGLDLCLRLRAAGGEVVVARESVAVHAGRCPADIPAADAARFTRRWLGRVPLFDPAGLRGRRPLPGRPGRPAVSVVVPVRNALPSVAPCLEGLARNLGPADELIIADAGSDDGSGEFAALFAREHARAARLVTADASGGVAEALRAGLGAATRRHAMLFHPVAAPPDGFLDAFLALVEKTGAPSSVATPTPPAGACVLGPTALLQDVAGATPDVYLSTDPAPLAAAVAARGERLGLVEQGEMR